MIHFHLFVCFAQARAAAPQPRAVAPVVPDPNSALQSANEQVLLLEGQVQQLAQEKAALQGRAEAAEARVLERDAAVRQAEERIAELQRHARDREAALQRQADAAEERARELARQLERAQQAGRIPDVRPVARALSGGVCTASYAELAAATRDFAAGSILGRGGFGPVYRGEWGGQAVAIKRLDQASAPLGSPPPMTCSQRFCRGRIAVSVLRVESVLLRVSA